MASSRQSISFTFGGILWKKKGKTSKDNQKLSSQFNFVASFDCMLQDLALAEVPTKGCLNQKHQSKTEMHDNFQIK